MLKNIIGIVIAIFFITCHPATAYKVKTFQPLQIAPLDVPHQNPAINENYPKITQIEISLFKRTYEQENIYNRLSRIEKRIFKENYPALPLSNRVDHILANIDAGIMYNIPQKELAKMENKILGRTYPNDDTESRITRLEKEMLGAMQGGNLTERYETVKTASKHYNSYPELMQSQSVYPQYNAITPQYVTKSGNRLGGFMQNIIGTLFGYNGTMTGFTPPIYDPYNPYSNYSPYNAYNPGMGMQDYVGNRYGYNFNNRNLGSQSAVRILD